jgi:hypothetical protein
MRRRFGQIVIGEFNKPVWVDIVENMKGEQYLRLVFNASNYALIRYEHIRNYAEALGFNLKYIYSRYGSYVKYFMHLPLKSAQSYLDSLTSVTERFKNAYEKNFDFKQEKSLGWVKNEKIFSDWLQEGGGQNV